MLKLELEELLEKELKILGVEFGRRVYGEEYYAGAEVDDNFGEDSTTKHRERVTSVNDPYAKMIVALFEHNLSKMQEYVFDEVIPFFSRESADYNGFRLEYIVHSPEELNSYELEADRIIKENKISHQCVDIFAGGALVASIGADWILNERGIVYAGFLDDYLPQFFVSEIEIKRNKEAKAVIKALEGKFFNADEVARAVIAYLKV